QKLGRSHFMRRTLNNWLKVKIAVHSHGYPQRFDSLSDVVSVYEFKHGRRQLQEVAMGGRPSDGVSFVSRPFGTMFGCTGGLFGPAGFSDMRALLLMRLHASSSRESESRGVIVQELTEDFEISSNGASDHHQHIVELPDDSVSLTHQANDQVWQESVYQISRDGMLPSEKTDGRLQNRSFHKCNLHQNGLDNLHYSLAAAKVSAKISKRNSTRIESTCPTDYLEPPRKQLRI
ncbi:hypothetical protein GOP47_0001236, partial [Adiantum capillus-veneris]